MKGKFKKQLSLLLTVSLLFFYVAYPTLSFAQEVTPTTTTVDNSATVSTDVSTTSDTGNNSIDATPTETPTPSVDPSITPTDTPTPTPILSIDPSPTPAIDISNTADVSDNSDSTTNTGNNSIIATGSGSIDDATPSANNSSAQNMPSDSLGINSNNNSTSPSPNSTVQTGNATSATTIVNDVNTNSINSTVINQTLNIFVTQNGGIDLSDPFTIASNVISAHPEDSVINVSVTNVNNYAYVTNDIASAAITGQNLINTPSQSATINTGDAFSAISLLNKVNFTVINSQIHLVTINIFGNLSGNIILPDPNASTNCSGCGVDMNINNTAQVSNNLNSTADTGDNSIIATGSASIATGNAQSSVNSLNLINTNVLGTNAEILFINNFGTWNGNFIGWGNFNPTLGGASLVFYNFSPNQNTSGSGQINLSNTAFVQNNVSSLALSGDNSITGNDSSISTGNSFSAISLMNFINTNFINSFGFFGFINIFGNWTGNIGGVSEFAALNNNSDTSNNVSNDSQINSDSSNAQDEGGQLSVENANNVGAFVYPGDTITFFIKVKNTGTGKVYSAKLNLSLVLNGQKIGTTSFNLGDIDAQKGIKITTGIVLPKDAQGGLYVATATATGNVGPDNGSVSANADSTFNILNNFALGNSPRIPHVTVLGAQSKSEKNSISTKSAQESSYLLVLLLVLFVYLIVRGTRKRKYLKKLLTSTDFKEKLSSLRMFLF